MLKDFAIIRNGIVENIIRADELQAVIHFFPEHQVIEPNEITGTPFIGLRFSGIKFEKPKSYDSWTWDEELFDYVAPVTKPEGDWVWNEDNQAWENELSK